MRQGAGIHPVVGVRWYDALAYGQWLTGCLRGWPEPLGTLLRKERWRVIVPSEAEWEKGARGGDDRIYPWGDEADTKRANYDETGINTTSAVGCFRNGASPYGVEEMSGNVWEWTRSLWGEDMVDPQFKYPYDPTDGREALEAPEYEPRVLRGGSFLNDQWDVRCACRYRDSPRNRLNNAGFRVVVLPSSEL